MRKLSFLFILLSALWSQLAYSSATVTVTSTADSGPGSLRQLIATGTANGVLTIKFDPTV